MTNLKGKTAVVLGGTSGVGKETVKALVSEGVRVIALARGSEGLRALESELGDGVETLQGDAANPLLAAELLRARRPDLVVLAAGLAPHLGLLDEQTWETFSQPWNSDLQASFHLLKAALTAPLAPGSTMVVVSSGAAITGSPISGGYAGAKRMQWLLAGYAQQRSDQKKLGIRFVAVLPTQLIEGTKIGAAASAAYGAAQGLTPEQFMKKRWEVPLDARKVAGAIVSVLAGDVAPGVTGLAVTGKGVESLG